MTITNSTLLPRRRRRAPSPRLLPVLVGLPILAYLALAAYMTLNQRSFLYRPSPDWESPAEAGLADGSRVELMAADGTRLLGWWVPPRTRNDRVFLYFHGNAFGLSRRGTRFRAMVEDGSGLLVMSYRGFGASGGSPSEATIHADARMIYSQLARLIAPRRIVIVGESLGTGVALKLAAEVKARGVVLDSPYLSVLERARAHYPWLPVWLLLADQFRSDRFIRQVDEPILIIHGTADRIVPVEESERLASLARPGQVTRKVFAGAPHGVPLRPDQMTDFRAWLQALP